MSRDKPGRSALEGQVEETLDLAKRLRREKRHDEAAEMLLAMLGHGVHADRILFQLGNVFFDAGDLSRAEYSYRRATEVNPNYASAYHNLGVIYKRRKMVAASITAQRKAMMLELQGKGRSSKMVSPEMANWARSISYQGLTAVGLFLILLVALIYSL